MDRAAAVAEEVEAVGAAAVLLVAAAAAAPVLQWAAAVARVLPAAGCLDRRAAVDMAAAVVHQWVAAAVAAIGRLWEMPAQDVLRCRRPALPRLLAIDPQWGFPAAAVGRQILDRAIPDSAMPGDRVVRVLVLVQADRISRKLEQAARGGVRISIPTRTLAAELVRGQIFQIPGQCVRQRVRSLTGGTDRISAPRGQAGRIVPRLGASVELDPVAGTSQAMAIFRAWETDPEQELAQAGAETVPASVDDRAAAELQAVATVQGLLIVQEEEEPAVEIVRASADDPAGVTARVVVECPVAAIDPVAAVIDRVGETGQAVEAIARVAEVTDLVGVATDPVEAVIVPAGVVEVVLQEAVAIAQVGAAIVLAEEEIDPAAAAIVLVEEEIDPAAVVIDQVGVGVQAVTVQVVEIGPAGIVQARGIVPSLAAVVIGRPTGITATTIGTMAITIGTTAITTTFTSSATDRVGTVPTMAGTGQAGAGAAMAAAGAGTGITMG